MAKRKATHKGTASAPVQVEVHISDTKYESGILADDIKHKRVWFEGPPDGDGWMKLYYSADGPTGDPFPIGSIRFTLAPDSLDGHFKNITKFTVGEAK